MFKQTPKNSEEEIEFDYELFDTDEKIKIATQTLERNINFVNKCDNKASFILAIVGVILSIVFSDDKTFVLIKELIKNIDLKDNIITSIFTIIYLLLIILSFILIVYGLGCLISVFYAKTNGSKIDSLVYFMGICKHKEYASDFKNMKKHQLLEDLIDQINTNAHIAKEKYNKYNRGFKYLLFGLLVFVVFIIIGVFVNT